MPAVDTKALRDSLTKAAADISVAIAAIDAGVEVPPVIVTPPAPSGPTTPDGRPWPPIRRSDFLSDYDYRAACDRRQEAAGKDANGFPKVIEVQGVHILAKAPIDPRYKSSMTAYIFGHQAGTSVWDVANGDEAIPYQPLRSPAGFPLRYTLAPDNSVIGSASVVFGEGSYSSDAEVLQMIAATPAPTPPHSMQEAYPNRAALAADAELDANCVRLDGDVIPTHDAKFGPCSEYVTQGDGSIRRGRYVGGGGGAGGGGGGGGGGAVTPPAGSFADKPALLAAFPGQAVILDGVLVQEGFAQEDGKPRKFVTAPPFIVPA